MSCQRVLLIVIYLLANVLIAKSQQIEIKADSIPLNKVLIQLRNEYHLKLSFNDRQLSKYIITFDTVINSTDEAISRLLKDLPLKYEQKENTYLIYTKKADKPSFNISGTVLDYQNFEALPYSHLLINGYGIVSDFKGRFSFKSTSDSVFNIKASYLGYYILDTTVHHGQEFVCRLMPSTIDLTEIVIEGKLVEQSMQTGSAAGQIRLNHRLANFLPGNGDNSVFNLLRLQPGILAAGERSGDLVIWGSYEGQVRVMFDGFTIFGMKNFNDNISAVNPFLAKDIKVLKGGYDAKYGNRVGAIVDISGVDGNTKTPSFNLTVNNLTLNGMLSVPVLKKSALVLAYRKTYYNLYNESDLNIISQNRKDIRKYADISVSPDYNFYDYNIKYSGKFNSGDTYHISFFNANDNFKYSVNQENKNNLIEIDKKDRNKQQGASVNYSKAINSDISTYLTVSYSKKTSENNYFHNITNNIQGKTIAKRSEVINDEIKEKRIENNYHIVLSGKHELEAGGEIIWHNIDFKEDSFNVNRIERKSTENRWACFIQDRFSITPKAVIKVGFRFDLSEGNGIFSQPRFSFSYKLSSKVKFNAACGIYNQFISQTTQIDKAGNLRYQWVVANEDKEIPVLEAKHITSGMAYSDKNFVIGAEAYLKYTDGITRFVSLDERRRLFTGNSRCRGIDFFVKTNFSQHTAWVSYSLSRTEENFSFYSNNYRRALHDQLHEFKIVGLLNFKPFYFSANYVYGSGFPDPAKDIYIRSIEHDYSRFDAAFIYKFSTRKIHFEAGFSILNLFNRENIKYANLIRIPSTQNSSININAEAVPFTPTLHLKISY